MQIPEPLYPRNGKRTTNKKKIIARGRKRERERQVAADGIAEEERRGGARICQGRHTRAQIYKAAAVLRPRKVPPAAPSPLPRAHTNDRSSRTGRDSTRLDSNRSAVVFEKLDSSPFLEKLTSSVRQYQGRGAVHGGGGAPTRASKHPVAPAWTVNLPVGRVRSVDTERREFLNERDKRM